jgi:glutamate dehydrogenase
MWFYYHLGIDDTYFMNESPEVISDHIIALFRAKVLAFTKHNPSSVVIVLERIDEKGNGATFIHTSPPGMTSNVDSGEEAPIQATADASVCWRLCRRDCLLSVVIRG